MFTGNIVTNTITTIFCISVYAYVIGESTEILKESKTIRN